MLKWSPFGRLPLRHVNPDQAIALGASVAAGLKSRDAKLEEIILTKARDLRRSAIGG